MEMDTCIMREEILKLFDVDDEEDIIIEAGVRRSEASFPGHDLTIFASYDDAEQEALKQLTDDEYLWRMAVANEETIEGLDDWAQDQVNMGGIEIICHYNGDYCEGKEYIYIITG
ncbi:MAG: hypothetical protein Q8N08_05665 [Methanobacteriaceae archaeon]|nr:hypothetical protein [Methanobacteriaceae archaeon]